LDCSSPISVSRPAERAPAACGRCAPIPARAASYTQAGVLARPRPRSASEQVPTARVPHRSQRRRRNPSCGPDKFQHRAADSQSIHSRRIALRSSVRSLSKNAVINPVLRAMSVACYGQKKHNRGPHWEPQGQHTHGVHLVPPSTRDMRS